MFMLSQLTGFNVNSSSASFAVTAIATNNVGSSSTTLALTTTVDVAAGSLIVVVAGNSSSNNISSVTDSAGNTYAVDVSATGTIRGGIASAPNCVALSSGSTITITFAAASSNRVGLAAGITGVATSAIDKTASATGTSTTPSSGSTATTTKADEIAIGMVCYDRNANPTFTEDALYTTIDSVIGGANVDRLNFAYQVLTSTGTPSYAPTQGASKQWSCAIATYKAR